MLQMELLLCHKRTINKYLFVTFSSFFASVAHPLGEQKGDNAREKVAETKRNEMEIKFLNFPRWSFRAHVLKVIFNPDLFWGIAWKVCLLHQSHDLFPLKLLAWRKNEAKNCGVSKERRLIYTPNKSRFEHRGCKNKLKSLNGSKPEQNFADFLSFLIRFGSVAW